MLKTTIVPWIFKPKAKPKYASLHRDRLVRDRGSGLGDFAGFWQASAYFDRTRIKVIETFEPTENGRLFPFIDEWIIFEVL
jgi:hypothetical protein